MFLCYLMERKEGCKAWNEHHAWFFFLLALLMKSIGAKNVRSWPIPFLKFGLRCEHTQYNMEIWVSTVKALLETHFKSLRCDWGLVLPQQLHTGHAILNLFNETTNRAFSANIYLVTLYSKCNTVPAKENGCDWIFYTKFQWTEWLLFVAGKINSINVLSLLGFSSKYDEDFLLEAENTIVSSCSRDSIHRLQ